MNIFRRTPKKFRIDIAESRDYKNPVALMYFGEEFFGLISRENETGDFKIQMPLDRKFRLGDNFRDLPAFDLREFEDTIQKAKERLNSPENPVH